MNKLEPIYAVIKDKAREQEKFYFKNWGLEPRNEHSFERMLTLQVVWAIGSMITVFSAVLFSFVLSRAPIVGLTLPAIFWVLSFIRPFIFIQYKYMFKNYSIKAWFKCQYDKKAE